MKNSTRGSLLAYALMALSGETIRNEPDDVQKEVHRCPICNKEHFDARGFCCAEHAQRYRQLRKEGKIQ